MILGVVLVVEDDTREGPLLQSALEARNVKVILAPGAVAARRAWREQAEHIRLVTLDIELDDPNAPGVKGTDLARELRAAPDERPALLFRTQFSQAEYYRVAVEVQADGYLEKLRTSHHDFACAVVAILLRIALEEAAGPAEIARLAGPGGSRSAAIERYCVSHVISTLAAVLANPFELLFHDADGTRLLTARPPGDTGEGLDSLIALAGAGSWDTPFVFDHAAYLASLRTPPLRSESAAGGLRRFDGAAFVPLADHRDVRLVLAILKGDPTAPGPYPDEPATLGRALLRHLRPEVFQRSLQVAGHWAAARDMAVRNATASFCRFAGGVQGMLLEQVEADGRLPESATHTLRSLTGQLEEAGAALSLAAEPPAADEVTPTAVGETVRRAFERTAAAFATTRAQLCLNEEICVRVAASDVERVCAHVFGWFFERFRRVEKEEEQVIRVGLRAWLTDAEISFEAPGAPLPGWVRSRLFEPFDAVSASRDSSGETRVQLGLFLARIVAQARLRGSLDDETEGNGHRFVLRMPLQPKRGVPRGGA
jgi:CheY-like chemotaxis protein